MTEDQQEILEKMKRFFNSGQDADLRWGMINQLHSDYYDFGIDNDGGVANGDYRDTFEFSDAVLEMLTALEKLK
jgi:hypothetical protein